MQEADQVRPPSQRGTQFKYPENARFAYRPAMPVVLRPRSASRRASPWSGCMVCREVGAASQSDAVSRDDRSIYFILNRDEGSIWVAALK